MLAFQAQVSVLVICTSPFHTMTPILDASRSVMQDDRLDEEIPQAPRLWVLLLFASILIYTTLTTCIDLSLFMVQCQNQWSKHELLISPSSSVSSDTSDYLLPVQQSLECCHCHPTFSSQDMRGLLTTMASLLILLSFSGPFFCQGWLRFWPFSLVRMVILVGHSPLWDAGKRQ